MSDLPGGATSVARVRSTVIALPRGLRRAEKLHRHASLYRAVKEVGQETLAYNFVELVPSKAPIHLSDDHVQVFFHRRLRLVDVSVRHNQLGKVDF